MEKVFTFQYRDTFFSVFYSILMLVALFSTLLSFPNLNHVIPSPVIWGVGSVGTLFFMLKALLLRRGTITFHDNHIIIHANSRVYNIEYTDINKTMTRGWYDYIIVHYDEEYEDLSRIILSMSVCPIIKEVDKLLIERVNMASKGRKGFTRLTSNWNIPSELH